MSTPPGAEARWAGMTHEEIHRLVADGPGAGGSAAAERAWRAAADALGAVHGSLSTESTTLPAGWEGTAADGARGGLGGLASWTGEAADGARRTADGLGAQAGLAAELRTRMPPPAEPGPPDVAPAGTALLDDWAAADGTAVNAAARAAELMQRYDEDSAVVAASFAGCPAPPSVTQAAGGTGADPAGGPPAAPVSTAPVAGGVAAGVVAGGVAAARVPGTGGAPTGPGGSGTSTPTDGAARGSAGTAPSTAVAAVPAGTATSGTGASGSAGTVVPGTGGTGGTGAPGGPRASGTSLPPGATGPSGTTDPPSRTGPVATTGPSGSPGPFHTAGAGPGAVVRSGSRTSGAEHRPPSGRHLTSGQRGPSGAGASSIDGTRRRGDDRVPGSGGTGAPTDRPDVTGSADASAPGPGATAGAVPAGATISTPDADGPGTAGSGHPATNAPGTGGVGGPSSVTSPGGSTGPGVPAGAAGPGPGGPAAGAAPGPGPGPTTGGAAGSPVGGGPGTAGSIGASAMPLGAHPGVPMAPMSAPPTGHGPIRADRPPAWTLVVDQSAAEHATPDVLDRAVVEPGDPVDTPEAHPGAGDDEAATPPVLRPADPWRHRG